MSDGALILTAELPPELHRWATDLRTAHFPPERNHLEAHVTLFHAIPPQCEEELRRLLAREVGSIAPIRARLEGLMPLGSGTALRLASPGILDLRDAIAEHLHGLLTAQDQHRPRLHVTIQNKVAPKEAKALRALLAGTFEPRDFEFPGLALHRYLGGPWEFVRRFAFRG
ncbi:2'-5' RNA ligase family protein [Erythrobacter sp. QSSC1-22B]|uniref:2'-5' RNA ligase family protein n=1 Tax=Erythrobacter sp. QSSC1-22B TaxID=1860125 RepID=UPI000B2C8DC7|nr:2'-5' RNA ligase family protein [Erythrobacter sp. QSSC1-22B]